MLLFARYSLLVLVRVDSVHYVLDFLVWTVHSGTLLLLLLSITFWMKLMRLSSNLVNALRAAQIDHFHQDTFSQRGHIRGSTAAATRGLLSCP